MTVVYLEEQNLTVEDYAAVLRDTTMRDRRPLANPARLAQMLRGANVIVTARDAKGSLLGLARCLSDGAWICFVAELAVKESAQGRGIGRGLLDKLAEIVGPRVGISLIAYPEVASFYEKSGMEASHGFYRARTDSQ